MQYSVERLVPSSILLKQGIYLQTCAHIELIAWRLVQMVDGIDPTSPDEVQKYVKLKLRTRDIVKRLRAAATNCHAPLGLRMILLANRIESGLVNRNMAAHGAWRLHVSGQLEVEHYLISKDGELRYISERFGTRAVDAAVEDADLILREAIDLHERFRAERRPFVSYTAPRGTEPQAVPPAPAQILNPLATPRPQRSAKAKIILAKSTIISRGLAIASY